MINKNCIRSTAIIAFLFLGYYYAHCTKLDSLKTYNISIGYGFGFEDYGNILYANNQWKSVPVSYLYEDWVQKDLFLRLGYQPTRVIGFNIQYRSILDQYLIEYDFTRTPDISIMTYSLLKGITINVFPSYKTSPIQLFAALGPDVIRKKLDYKASTFVNLRAEYGMKLAIGKRRHFSVDLEYRGARSITTIWRNIALPTWRDSFGYSWENQHQQKSYYLVLALSFYFKEKPGKNTNPTL